MGHEVFHKVGYFSSVDACRQYIGEIDNDYSDAHRTGCAHFDYYHIAPTKSVSKTFESKKAVDDYVSEHDRYYDSSWIIPYYETVSSKEKDLYRRLDETKVKLKDYIENNKLWKRKSKSVSCDYCKAVLPISYAKRNKDMSDGHCPICESSLMSDTYRKTVRGYEDKIEKLKSELRKAKKEEVTRRTKIVRYAVYVGVDLHV